ncbi:MULTISPECIES: hypothetical protein [Rhizobium]|nr:MULTISPECIES: hypothetical protein [Rhizobium]KAF5881288.1 hypothetical protein FY112_30310 [Rhizobium sp. PEPV16]MBY5770072.1 hypothetical protein [Rhizobium leguminosarum]MBY5791494.1 hypothetical protein [Rhizobium leguminosarum]MBY5796193.1 hypothetical protein [Rhizobium leguminosarum]
MDKDGDVKQECDGRHCTIKADRDDDHELSASNRAATLFPVRVLLLAK